MAVRQAMRGKKAKSCKKAKRPSAKSRKVQPGRPRNEDIGKTFQAQKPWLAEGCCRATWYNRRRAKRDARA